MSGGGGKTQTTQQTAKSEPWAAQQPYLTHGFEQARQQYDSDQPSFYPGQTYTDFDPATVQALDMQQSRAVGGNPLTTAAQREAGMTLGGDYLSAGNPYMGAMTDRISGDVARNVNSQFGAGGRFGSGLHAEAIARGTGDALAPIQFQNYADERGRMQNAMMAAPGLAQQDYFDIGQLAGVGATREGKAGEALQGDIERYNFGENIERLKLADYMGLIQGNYGGETQSMMSQPLYRNGLASGLGGAASGAAMGSMFGPVGMGAGALLGGALGYFG
jgi:hypothetical protein